MSKSKTDAAIMDTIDRINAKLDMLTEQLAWLVRAGDRFRKGQRVQFSALAKAKGISKRKHGADRGRVIGTTGFTVTVLLDGYKQPSSFHHMFFDPAEKE